MVRILIAAGLLLFLLNHFQSSIRAQTLHAGGAATASDDNELHNRFDDLPPFEIGSWVADAWPYTTQSTYRTMPVIRYNRVEGAVLGIGIPPLSWESTQRARIFGQGGYAIALSEWRYTTGFEIMPGRRPGDWGVKFGFSTYYNTFTEDEWKTRWTENTLASALFKNDFMDYYEIRGWSVFGVQRLSRFAQISAAFRRDDYRSLSNQTNWALFSRDHFRANPFISPGTMHSVVMVAEGGQVSGLFEIPKGHAFQVEIEAGDGLGGDFSFNRIVADGRVYLATSDRSALNFRARAGYASGQVPLQKQFSIGGVGSVRGYTQNAFMGTQMLSGNLEFLFDSEYLIRRLLPAAQAFVFADAGLLGDRHAPLSLDPDDLFAAAGAGISLDKRRIRFELAWPLGPLVQRNPTLWFRLYPTF